MVLWTCERRVETTGRKGHSEEKIPQVLREAESGDAEVEVEICRKHGISQQKFHARKKKYVELG